MAPHAASDDAQALLIVEGDSDIANLLTIHLGDMGYRAEVAADGRTGLERAREGDFALDVQSRLHEGTTFSFTLPTVRSAFACERDMQPA